MHRRQPLSEESRAAWDRLANDMSGLEAERVEDRLVWFERRLPWWSPSRRAHDRRRSRGLVLFVLLCILTSPAMNARALLEVLRVKVLGSPSRLDVLLKSLSGHTNSREERALRRTYLDLFREVGSDIVAQTSAGDLVAEFQRRSWLGKLLLLEKRRMDAGFPLEVSGKPNPEDALRAGKLEFELARAGAYGKLAEEGGALARESLAAMGYVDFHPRRTPGPSRRVIFLVLLVALAISASVFAWWRAKAWDQDNQRFVAAARATLDAHR
jgi:hypothetical protein